MRTVAPSMGAPSTPLYTCTVNTGGSAGATEIRSVATRSRTPTGKSMLHRQLSQGRKDACEDVSGRFTGVLTCGRGCEISDRQRVPPGRRGQVMRRCSQCGEGANTSLAQVYVEPGVFDTAVSIHG